MNKNTIYILIAVAVFVVGVLMGGIATKSNTFGGVYNNAQYFANGVQVGSPSGAGCIKVEDTDKGGYSYITILNGTVVATGGASPTIPTGCADLGQ